MHVPAAVEIVSAWERAVGETAGQRALTLLCMACPDEHRAALASLPVAERDRRLLHLRERLFGPVLNSCADCPKCGAQLEFNIDATTLRTAGDELSPICECSADGRQIRFRLPTGADLDAVAGARNVAEARRRLAQRCIVETRAGDEPAMSVEMSDAIVDRMAASLSVIDQQDPVLDVRCAACDQRWTLEVDIAAFLWVEVNALARGLLRQVHTLAWAYGWSEADVLRMTSVRRELYLRMVHE